MHVGKVMAGPMGVGVAALEHGTPGLSRCGQGLCSE
jgi:hypothetical protein